ncbi:lactosylceramide 1,3-N-acetyl-beta-D-glucosaminyltransferase A-like [Culicoides brevitarsis]|uniref:lactosylceramide 1,3-N-acetyl-beta-D-glucosaminyltransferase A-like n=1 Tax=Culicoides brevitarsis TaxID=469753 RepID=UPI00307C8798
MALKWLKYFCPNARYLLKVDDDVAINTPRILNSIKKGDFGEKKDLLLCRYMRSPQPVIREKTNKWFVTYEEYPAEKFPQYCSGYAIFYSSSAAIKIYEASQTLKYFWIEDVFVTGIARQKAGIQGTNIMFYAQFHLDKAKLLMSLSEEYRNSFILAANFAPASIREIWATLLTSRN